MAGRGGYENLSPGAAGERRAAGSKTGVCSLCFFLFCHVPISLLEFFRIFLMPLQAVLNFFILRRFSF